MKHNRKFLWFAIALIMLFSSTIPAFAAMPIDTVIVGNKAYDFEYFQNNAEAILDVQAALDAGENVYVKFDGGMLNVVINEFLENSEELPEVEYYDKDGNVTRYEAGDGDPVESEFKVIEISAINANTISVTFEGMEPVEIELEEALVVGENQVTFTYNEQEFTETVNYEAPVATELEISNTQLANEDGVKLNYVVKDQYGQEIEVAGTAFTVTAYNVTQGASVTNINKTAAGITLDLVTATVAKDDVIRVTLIHTATGLKKVVELPVVAATGVASVALGDFVLPTGAERLTESTTDVVLNYTAVDQYGEAIELANVTGLTFLVSPTGAVTNFQVQTVGGKAVLTFDTAAVTKDTEVTVTVLVDATGETSSTTFTVYDSAAIDSVTLTKPADTVYAVNDTTAKISIAAVDQFGKALTNAEIQSAAAAGSIILSSSNQLVLPNSVLSGATFNADGTITVDLTGTTAGTATIFAQVGANIAEFVIEIGEARAPKELLVKTAPEATIAESGSTDVEFELKDQYGADILVGAYTISVKGTPTKVTVTDTDAYNKNIAGLAVGTEKITFELKDGSSNVVDSQVFDIEVVADLASFVVTVDKTEYTAGDDIVLTIKAEKAGSVAHTDYNSTDVLTIDVGAKEYLRTVEFVDGVATTTVPATTAGATVAVNASLGAVTGTAVNVKVVAAEASKFVLTQSTNDLVITLQDDYGNTITSFAGNKLVEVTYPAAADITGSGIDAEGNALVTFANGVGTISFTTLADGDYTVTFEGFTGTLEVK